METQNLWPDFTIETTKSPKTILKEQAGHLMEKTNNVLSAEVDTSQSKEKIFHNFYIVAPAINNYRYRVLLLTHEVFFYPLEIIWVEKAVQYGAKNQDEFLNILSEIFNAPETVRVISSLLSQSLAE